LQRRVHIGRQIDLLRKRVSIFDANRADSIPILTPVVAILRSVVDFLVAVPGALSPPRRPLPDAIFDATVVAIVQSVVGLPQTIISPRRRPCVDPTPVCPCFREGTSTPPLLQSKPCKVRGHMRRAV
jgi:hypothetical protein